MDNESNGLTIDELNKIMENETKYVEMRHEQLLQKLRDVLFPEDNENQTH